MYNIHLNDIGTTFTLTIKNQDEENVDLSEATSVEIVLEKPSGEILTRDATLIEGGTAGGCTYTSQLGDIDEVGIWHIQAVTEFDETIFHSTVSDFLVWQNSD